MVFGSYAGANLSQLEACTGVGLTALARLTCLHAEIRRADREHMKVREIVRLIERDGWQVVRTRGSHRQFKHPTKPGLVTVPGKPAHDLHPKTQGSILRQAGLKR